MDDILSLGNFSPDTRAYIMEHPPPQEYWADSIIDSYIIRFLYGKPLPVEDLKYFRDLFLTGKMIDHLNGLISKGKEGESLIKRFNILYEITHIPEVGYGIFYKLLTKYLADILPTTNQRIDTRVQIWKLLQEIGPIPADQIFLTHTYPPVKSIFPGNFEGFFTKESLWSITLPEIMTPLIEAIKNILPQAVTITDATASIGISSMCLAEHFKVHAVEYDDLTYDALVKNIQNYELSGAKSYRINTIHADYTSIATTLDQDVIFIDPPWGLDYKNHPRLKLELGKIPLGSLIRKVAHKAKLIVLKVPTNFDMESLPYEVILPTSDGRGGWTEGKALVIKHLKFIFLRTSP